MNGLKVQTERKICVKQKIKFRKCHRCDLKVFHVSKLYKHQVEIHGNQNVIEKKTFDSIEEFKTYKEEDAKNFMKAQNRWGTRFHKETLYIYYVCNFKMTTTVLILTFVNKEDADEIKKGFFRSRQFRGVHR